MAGLTTLLFFVFSGFFSYNAAQLLQPNGDCNADGTICEYKWKVEHRDTMITYDETTGAGLPVVTYGRNYYKRNRDITKCATRDALSLQEREKVLTVDGSYGSATVINGQLPGPDIIVKVGTQVVVHVTNDLMMEGVAIHWHGIVQRNTPWMDGVQGVSHCPINPGETFTYRFLATPPGTHWYHSHLGTQRTDGLYGALIVLPEEEEISVEETTDPDFSGDFIMLLQDWMRSTSLDINNRILWELQRFYPGYNNTATCFYQTRQSDGTEIGVVPFTSGLVNGKGLFYRYETGGKKREFIENYLIPMEMFTVERLKTYRFRVINAAMIFAFSVSIEEHKLHVISTDGNRVSTVIADALIVNSGERFDFYIETNNNPANYWINIRTLETSNINSEILQSPGHVEAILHYAAAPAPKYPATKPRPYPCSQSSRCNVVNCPFSYFPPSKYTDCIPAASLTSMGGQPPPPRFPESNNGSVSGAEEHFINFHFDGITSKRSSVNGRRFVPPSTPPMTLPGGDYEDYMTVCNETECAQHCSCTHFIEIKTGNVIQIVLHNMGNANTGTAHPVHMHGHHFYLLKTAFAKYDANGVYTGDNDDIDCGGDSRCNNGKWKDPTWGGDKIPGLNLINPPMKDTVIVPVGGYVVIRYLADNPGWWFVHCHIEIHQVEGMALMFKEGDESEMNPPPKDFRSCGNFHWTSEEFYQKIKDPVSAGGVKVRADWCLLIIFFVAYMLQ